MAELRGQELITTNFTDEGTEFEASTESLQSPSYQEETSYTPEFNRWNWYYKNIPEAKTLLDVLARWVFGKGLKGETSKLKRIVGNGKEHYLRVLRNIWIVSKICGDGFGHIIKDKQGRLVNLKALNAQSMKIVYNKFGIIKRYEQMNATQQIVKTFQPDEILHLTSDRIGDEIHGIPLFEALEELILARGEVVKDLRTLFHRFVKPIQIFESDTDDETTMAKQASKINKAYALSENMIVPKGTLAQMRSEIVSTQTGGLSPLEYYRLLIRIFTTACGVPELIMGWAAESSEASSKIVYLAWEQTIEEQQLLFEQDIEAQLNIKITLEFPATIEEQLLKDQKKDGPLQGKKDSELNPAKHD
jgi:hypothetical protein